MGSQPAGISASRGAAVLGLSKYSTPVEAWIQIMEQRSPGFCARHGYPPPEPADSMAIHWGHALEEPIIRLAEGNALGEISDREKFYTTDHAVAPLTCHIDGMYSDGTIHEGKTANERAYRAEWGDPGTDRIPEAYQVQVQHQMMLTGATRAIVSVLVLPRSQDEMGDPRAKGDAFPGELAFALAEIGYFHQYIINADPNLHRIMTAAYDRFRQVYIIGEIPPEPRDIPDLKRLLVHPVGTVIADEQVERWSQELRAIRDELKRVGDREAELKTEILRYMRDCSMADGIDIDADSTEKLVLKSRDGYNLHSYTDKGGRKIFR